MTQLGQEQATSCSFLCQELDTQCQELQVPEATLESKADGMMGHRMHTCHIMELGMRQPNLQVGAVQRSRQQLCSNTLTTGRLFVSDCDICITAGLSQADIATPAGVWLAVLSEAEGEGGVRAVLTLLDT